MALCTTVLFTTTKALFPRIIALCVFSATRFGFVLENGDIVVSGTVQVSFLYEPVSARSNFFRFVRRDFPRAVLWAENHYKIPPRVLLSDFFTIHLHPSILQYELPSATHTSAFEIQTSNSNPNFQSTVRTATIAMPRITPRDFEEAHAALYAEAYQKAGGPKQFQEKEQKVEAAINEFFDEEDKKGPEMRQTKPSDRYIIEHMGVSIRDTGYTLNHTFDSSGKLKLVWAPRPEAFEVWLRQRYPELTHDACASDGEGVLRIENSQDASTVSGEGVLRIEDSKEKSETVKKE